jgi:hypothetical protein
MSKNLTADQMLDLLRQAFSPGNWFKFPMPFLDHMTVGEAILLAYLSNHSDRCGRHGDWFYCSATAIEADLRLNESAQVRLIRKLKGRELLHTKKEGMPARRLFRINWKLLAYLLQEQIEQDRK